MRSKRIWRELSEVEAGLKETASDPSRSRTAKTLLPRLRELLEQLPQVLDTERGQHLLAIAAAVQLNWKRAARHYRVRIAHMVFMHELAQTEVPIVRRAMLRDYSSRRIAEAYDQLAVAHRKAGAALRARTARQQAKWWRSLEERR